MKKNCLSKDALFRDPLFLREISNNVHWKGPEIIPRKEKIPPHDRELNPRPFDHDTCAPPLYYSCCHSVYKMNHMSNWRKRGEKIFIWHQRFFAISWQASTFWLKVHAATLLGLWGKKFFFLYEFSPSNNTAWDLLLLFGIGRRWGLVPGFELVLNSWMESVMPSS